MLARGRMWGRLQIDPETWWWKGIGWRGRIPGREKNSLVEICGTFGILPGRADKRRIEKGKLLC